MLTSDRVQPWSEFLKWWRQQEDSRAIVMPEAWKDAAGAAWLAACEWAWSLRGDE